MIRVLVNAYACSPGMGSEPGMAWNWCVNLAKYCELHIITEGEFRDKIELTLPTLPQGVNMHFYYNPVTDKVRKMCWNQGDWRFYKYYKEWQYKTYLLAQDIINDHNIDIVHQLNMIGFREPGFLWKLDKPFVWGPIDAKDRYPTAYMDGENIQSKIKIHIKNYLTILQLKYDKRIRHAALTSKCVISASSVSQKNLKNYFGIESPLLNETGCYNNDLIIINDKQDDLFKILWVGKLESRKQLILAIRTIAELNNKKVQLHIVGGGKDNNYKVLAEQLNISDLCVWHGIVSHDAVQSLMVDSDILLFTSVAEGTPHVVLEAISNQLPVVCFDTCGHGDSVDESVGIKIALSNPQQSVKDFAECINYLIQNRYVLKKMSFNCINRQKELSWDSKALQMVEIYNQHL